MRDDPDFAGAGEPNVEAELWPRSDHLMALLVEGVRDMRLHLAAVLGDKKAGNAKRDPIPRPGLKAGQKREPANPAVLAVVLNLMADGVGEDVLN